MKRCRVCCGGSRVHFGAISQQANWVFEFESLSIMGLKPRVQAMVKWRDREQRVK